MKESVPLKKAFAVHAGDEHLIRMVSRENPRGKIGQS